ncbi:hypothetical protein LTR62_000656 [Meristemomyces frigidus]|uniref:cyclin-dependent kinase n=1 Tax=Meristemomyces frigidus TaxID=1508187 RepID=A0AAN7YMS7_9PEZI|nr:hypothetical protein LTR62_000656 [Meristemomyces frigidus]
MPSRWAVTAEDAAEDARRKAEKEEKKRVKAERQRKDEEARRAAQPSPQPTGHDTHEEGRATKRRRLSRHDDDDDDAIRTSTSAAASPDMQLFRYHPKTWSACRSITNFDLLNHIEEGSYGHVSRARAASTGEIVAIKKLKLDPIRDAGFAVTALREIQCLQASKHRHIVELREVVYGTAEGSSHDHIYLVMDFLEHDLKTLQEEMAEPFMPSEVKTLLLQLSSAVEYLHDHWILHRDLKTSNILLNNRGEVKLADFGMARFVGDPAPANLTQLVVTLWYRAPELLLGAKEYDGAIDVWSLGCIFGELMAQQPLMPGKNEVDQLAKIFTLCGIPTEANWPGFRRLPNAASLRLPPSSNSGNTSSSFSSSSSSSSSIRTKFPSLTNAGSALLTSLLALNPAARPTAKGILSHQYFTEDPRPKPTAMFPTFPSKAGQERRRRQASPDAPERGTAPKLEGEVDFSTVFEVRDGDVDGKG